MNYRVVGVASLACCGFSTINECTARKISSVHGNIINCHARPPVGMAWHGRAWSLAGCVPVPEKSPGKVIHPCSGVLYYHGSMSNGLKEGAPPDSGQDGARACCDLASVRLGPPRRGGLGTDHGGYLQQADNIKMSRRRSMDIRPIAGRPRHRSVQRLLLTPLSEAPLRGREAELGADGSVWIVARRQ